jgi:hypothetical protein
MSSPWSRRARAQEHAPLLGVASELDVMKIIDRRLYDPITSQLKRALESGRGTAAALAEARRTKLTKHHPELSGLVEDVRRIH